mmetsp:Transcript_48143/g.148597  ORF Transcript_48143/g.148597 Transcript_48143/m.148597 type:complete len:233 (-) Transcript_48143:158-856(-)
MARFAGLLVVALCSLGTSARVDGLGDGLVAYQESLRAHKARKLHDDSQHIKMDVSDAVAKALSTSPLAASGSSGEILNFHWKTLEIEEGSSVSLQLDHGCKDDKDGFTFCSVDLNDNTNTIAADIHLKRPLDNATQVESDMKIKVAFFEDKRSYKCPACGGSCMIHVYTIDQEVQAPSCPLPKDKVSLDLPFSKLGSLPSFLSLPSLNGELQSKVVRGDGSVVATFEVRFSK